MVTRETSWVDEAACATHELRKVRAWDYDVVKYRKAAAEVCGSCPVRDECLSYAQNDPRTEGMFAGEMFKVRAKRGTDASESYEVS